MNETLVTVLLMLGILALAALVCAAVERQLRRREDDEWNRKWEQIKKDRELDAKREQEKHERR